MKLKFILSLCVLLFACSAAFGQANLDVQDNDSMQSILQRQVGQTVELRLASGEKIGGKLDKVNDKIVHLSQVTGSEYFSAVVAVEQVAAVLVRTKK